MWQSGYITANGLQLHYTRTGGGRPPLVLAHGVTDDGLCWTPVAQALEADYDVIMVDARGHGRSEAPAASYAALDLSADLAGVITGLGLVRPAILGHSMGAVTTLVLAGTYPEIPGAILLEDPPDWWMPPAPGQLKEAQARHKGFSDWLNGCKQQTREQLIAAQRAAAPAWAEAELGPWADSKLRCSLNVLNLFGSDPSAGIQWPALLGRVSCPALLISADPARGGIITPASAQALKGRVPQLQVTHIPGAGHNIRREQFAAYLAAVRAFLAR